MKMKTERRKRDDEMAVMEKYVKWIENRCLHDNPGDYLANCPNCEFARRHALQYMCEVLDK